jgi:alpha-beta hydrolase superfamily lysophospholipase
MPQILTDVENMKHIEDNFIGIDEVRLYYQVWRPEKNPKAVVQVVHGLAEHSGRYINVVNALIPRGYTIYAADHRGHGKSEGIRAYVKKFEYYVKDQKTFFDLIKENEPNLPIFLLGHSMGAIIAQMYAVTYPENLKGLVLSGAGTQLGGTGSSTFLRGITKLLSKIIPKRKIDPKLSKEISRDPNVVTAYEDDPLVFSKITFKLGAELMAASMQAKKLISQIRIPTLVQSGSSDKLVLGADELDELMIMPDKTIIIYEGLYHEVYNELAEDRRRVLTDLGDWLDDHI